MKKLLLLVGTLLFLPKANAFIVSTSSSSLVPKTTTTQLSLQNDSYFWRKERSAAEVETHVHACLDSIDCCNLQANVRVISAEPPLVLIHNFISPDMCKSIISTALAKTEENGMQLSTTGNVKTQSSDRTSSTVWLKEADANVAGIDGGGGGDSCLLCRDACRLIAEKFSVIIGLPCCNMENLQVVRYLPGQEFKLHTDHQESFNELALRGRLATCLLYLNEPEAGGDTWFPNVVCQNNENQQEVILSPTRGSAVFFWNTVQRPGSPGYDAEMFLHVDHQMRHAGLPVIAGEKWICNRWIHPVDFGSGVRGTREPVAVAEI
jgi:prolyl 4-hydroxylase